MNIETDFLVVGSGIAGLSFALKAAEYGKVMIVTKGELGECNTDYAQGGIASVMYDPDTSTTRWCAARAFATGRRSNRS